MWENAIHACGIKGNPVRNVNVQVCHGCKVGHAETELLSCYMQQAICYDKMVLIRSFTTFN